MSRKKESPKSGEFDRARDELFNHIHRCGVLRATAEQQVEWMDDTVEYMGERYTSLSREQLGELRTMGLRFCRPVIDSGPSEEEVQEGAGGSDDAREVAA